MVELEKLGIGSRATGDINRIEPVDPGRSVSKVRSHEQDPCARALCVAGC